MNQIRNGMATSLSQSIKDCIETREKQTVDKLFDRMHTAVEEFVRQETVPLSYCYQNEQEPVNSFSELLQLHK